MAKLSVDKGKVGERQLSCILRNLTGLEVKRKVRQSKGEADLEGIPGWAVETKRAKVARLPEWWRQTVAQAVQTDARPVLFYRLDGKKWRAVWSLSALLADFLPGWVGLDMTAESSVEGWAAVCRETAAGGDRDPDPPPSHCRAVQSPQAPDLAYSGARHD